MPKTVEIPFHYDLSAKALTTELADGDLLIEGYGLKYHELDREDEAWDETSALARGIRTFLKGNAPLCFQHNPAIILGKVLEAEPVPGEGIRVKAVVHYQPEGSPWRHYYEAAKREALANFSFGGFFRRRETSKGPVIEDADFTELSICGVSIGRNTSWKIIAGKALTAPEGKAVSANGELDDLWASVHRLRADAERLRDRKRPTWVTEAALRVGAK